MWLLDLQSPQPTSHTKVPKIMLRCRLTTRRIGKTQYREASSLRDLVLCPVSCKYFAEPLRPNCWPEICCDGFLRTWVSWELHLDIIIVWKHQNTHEKKKQVFGCFLQSICASKRYNTSYLSHLKKSPTGCPGTIQAVAQIQSPIAISAANPAADGFTEFLGPRPSGRLESETSMASKIPERYTHTPNKMQLVSAVHKSQLSGFLLKTSKPWSKHPPAVQAGCALCGSSKAGNPQEWLLKASESG